MITTAGAAECTRSCLEYGMLESQPLGKWMNMGKYIVLCITVCDRKIYVFIDSEQDESGSRKRLWLNAEIRNISL